MTIQTKSAFIFDFVIDAESSLLNFDEGSIELTAELNPGSYTMTELADEISRALNIIGTQEYSVSLDRSTRKYTISAASNFTLLSSTGSNVGFGAWEVMGFSTASDKTGSNSYESDNSAGQLFRPQFHLQSYISFDDWQGFASSNINESASGVTEIYSLGSRKFSEFNISYQNNGIAGSKGSSIDYDANGVDNLRNFMEFAITKGPMEFIPDRDNFAIFDKIILERTPANSKGTEFKLKELVNRNLVGYFETGVLKFRLQE